MCFVLSFLQRVSFSQVDKWSVPKEEKVKFSIYAVRFLLPWLKEFHQEQMLEKNVEARVRGIMIALSLSAFLSSYPCCYSLVLFGFTISKFSCRD